MTTEKDLTIEVLYSCECGLVDAAVRVPARTTENVVEWVEQIMSRAISDDHAKRSPDCRAVKMTNVKIPIGNSDRVGGTSVQ